MLRHSQDQIGLHRGWGADKPIVHVNMEIDPLGTSYRLGKFPRGGGQADLVHSMYMVYSLSLMEDLIHAWVSILNCEWPDGHSGGRDLWQDTDPLCSLAPGERSVPVELIATNQGGPHIGADTNCMWPTLTSRSLSSHACRFEGW